MWTYKLEELIENTTVKNFFPDSIYDSTMTKFPDRVHHGVSRVEASVADHEYKADLYICCFIFFECISCSFHIGH